VKVSSVRVLNTGRFAVELVLVLVFYDVCSSLISSDRLLFRLAIDECD